METLMLELESGGNVRFEEGRQEDTWFKATAELVRSRFMPGLGVEEVHVARVVRLHNRLLKDRLGLGKPRASRVLGLMIMMIKTPVQHG